MWEILMVDKTEHKNKNNILLFHLHITNKLFRINIFVAKLMVKISNPFLNE